MMAIPLLLPLCVQHALQASKTDDAELKDSIRQAKNAIEAKKIARVVKVMTTISCSRCEKNNSRPNRCPKIAE